VRPLFLSLTVFLGACADSSLTTDGGGVDTASTAQDTASAAWDTASAVSDSAGGPLDAGLEASVQPQTECPKMLHALSGFRGTPCALPPEKTCMYLGGLCQCAYHVEEVWACRDNKWERIMSTTCPACPPPPAPGDAGGN
jgi:hypothetical protein